MIKYCLTLQAHVGLTNATLGITRQECAAHTSISPEYTKYFEAIVTTLTTLCDYMSKLVDLLSSVSASLRELLSLAKTGQIVVNGGGSSSSGIADNTAGQVGVMTSSAAELPEFLRDNVWVDIIRSKFSTT